MGNLNILVLALHLPYPPYDGGSMRTLELLKAIADKHQVTAVFTYNPRSVSREQAIGYANEFNWKSEIVPIDNQGGVWTRGFLMKDLISYPPKNITKHISQEYILAVEALLKQKFDIIICNSILAGQTLLSSSLGLNASTPKILDLFDIFDLSHRREYRLEQSRRLIWFWKYANWQKVAYYERQIWNLFDAFIAISEVDSSNVRRHIPGKTIVSIPSGIHQCNCSENDNEYNKRYDLLMVGKLDYLPNIDALDYFDRDILPGILQYCPDIRVAIVGKNPGEEINRLVSKRNNYNLIPNPPDVSIFYKESRVVIIPMRTGSGIKIKLLEALSYGSAIVTTSTGAYGIPVNDNEHVAIADLPSEFVYRVISLLGNSKLASDLGVNGKVFIKDNYDWTVLKQKYLQFLESFS